MLALATPDKVRTCKCVGVWKVMCQCVGVWKVMCKCVGGRKGDVEVCEGINISGEG